MYAGVLFFHLRSCRKNRLPRPTHLQHVSDVYRPQPRRCRSLRLGHFRASRFHGRFATVPHHALLLDSVVIPTFSVPANLGEGW